MTEVQPQEFTRFQLDLLAVIGGGGADTRTASGGRATYGLGIKRTLEGYYGEEVLHGRLYPNLDDLVEKGLVAKSERDKRTNEYAITDQGRDVLRARIEWLTTQAGLTVRESDPAPIAGEGGAAGGVE